MPSAEDLDSSSQTPPAEAVVQPDDSVSPPDLSLKTIGDEFSNRFAEDTSSMFSNMMEQDDFGRSVAEISSNQEKSEAQKQLISTACSSQNQESSNYSCFRGMLMS